MPGRVPGEPGGAVAGRAVPPIQPALRDPDERQAEAARTGNWFFETNLVIARLDKLSRNEDVQAKLAAPDCGWDLVVCDEAHKMSATFFGGEVKYTKRYKLGQLLSTLTRHFLLMTATPHNGKEEDFQLFMALLDGDRFEGRFRDGVHASDVSDLMRRMVKEGLLKFDATPLFPERIAYTVPYLLSDAEANSVQGGHRLRPAGVQSRGGASERQARRHGRLRAHRPAASPRVSRPRRSTSPSFVAANASRSDCAKRSCCSAEPSPASTQSRTLPAMTDEDIEDIEDAPDDEQEQTSRRSSTRRRPREPRRACRPRSIRCSTWRRWRSRCGAAARTGSGASWRAC